MYTQSIYALFLALYIHLWSSSAQTLCYNPDGTVPSTPYTPCNSTAEGVHSACCTLGDVCSNRDTVLVMVGPYIGVASQIRLGLHSSAVNNAEIVRNGNLDIGISSSLTREAAIDSYSNVYHCGLNNGSEVGLWCCGGKSNTSESIAGCCNTTLFYPGSPLEPEFGGFFAPATEPSNPVPSSPGTYLTTIQNAPISKPQQQWHERVAIGLGVGIPFCLIASGSLLLLFREHKLRLRAESTARIINDKRLKGGEGSERGLHGSEDHNAPQELENELKDPNELDSQQVHEVAPHDNTYRLGWMQSPQVL